MDSITNKCEAKIVEILHEQKCSNAAYDKSFPANTADLLVLDTDRSSAFETTFPVGVSPWSATPPPSQHDTKLSGFTFDVGMSVDKVRLR
jgi:hypothetical protein